MFSPRRWATREQRQTKHREKALARTTKTTQFSFESAISVGKYDHISVTVCIGIGVPEFLLSIGHKPMLVRTQRPNSSPNHPAQSEYMAN